MNQNIKIDILYYTISTDFEMEFNLCGCCRMRMLTDKASTRKELAVNLARSVSRSKIVIVCGPLFGEKGLIETVSAVAEIGLEKIDNDKYAIEEEADFSILQGSVPLVSSDGIFGGCIIEKKQQTIILLTENKSLRKRIMNELIHPYVSRVAGLVTEQGAQNDEFFVLDEKKILEEELDTTPAEHCEEDEPIEQMGEYAQGEEFVLETPAVDDDDITFESDYVKQKDQLDSQLILGDFFDNEPQTEKADDKSFVDIEDVDGLRRKERRIDIAIRIMLIIIVAFILGLVAFILLRSIQNHMSIFEYLDRIFTPNQSFIELLPEKV